MLIHSKRSEVVAPDEYIWKINSFWIHCVNDTKRVICACDSNKLYEKILIY